MRSLFLAAILAFSTCGTPRTNPPITWDIVASGAIIGLRAGAAAAAPILAADTRLTQAQHDDIARSFRIIDDSLGLATTSLATYANNRDLPSQCRLHANIDSAITASLQITALLVDTNVPVPPELAVGIGAIGTIADALVPGCTDAGAPSPNGQRIRASFARRHS